MEGLLGTHKDRYDKDWQKTLSNDDKLKILGKLDILEDLSNYLDCLREGYTRTLKINNVSDDGEIKEPTIERYSNKDLENLLSKPNVAEKEV